MTTLFSTPATLPRPKHTMLPVLVVLFLISYGLMTLLVVEQGSTIDSQHTLIRQLLGDTRELAAMKGKAIREQAMRDQALSRQAQPKTQEAPSTQATPAPSTQTPSAEKAKPSHNSKAQRPVPARPPKPASDLADSRRNLMSI